MRILLTLSMVLALTGIASALDKVWSVPGVINNGIGTVFSCTNGGTAAASVSVDLFTKSGAPHASASVVVAPGATANFATQPVAALPILEANLNAGTLQSGSGRITAPAGVYCTAYVVDPANDPPSVGWQLTIVAKTKQRGD